MKTPDLFIGTEYEKRRRPPRQMAHMADAGVDAIEFECQRCGWNSDWIENDYTDTQIMRGIPCPECNEADDVNN